MVLTHHTPFHSLLPLHESWAFQLWVHRNWNSAAHVWRNLFQEWNNTFPLLNFFAVVHSAVPPFGRPGGSRPSLGNRGSGHRAESAHVWHDFLHISARNLPGVLRVHWYVLILIAMLTLFRCFHRLQHLFLCVFEDGENQKVNLITTLDNTEDDLLTLEYIKVLRVLSVSAFGGRRTE